MELTKSILKSVREYLGMDTDGDSFDPEILIHINAAISRLNQNGIGQYITVTDESTTWNQLIDVSQIEGNRHFNLVPLYVTISTKVIFDPPPPSMVEYYSKNADELLWRLKIAYEIKGE